MKADTHSELSELTSIKAKVFKLLKKNPLLTGKPLCKLLDLPYPQYKSYMDNIRHEWKNSLRFRQGSKVKASFHHAHGYVYVDRLNLKIEDAVSKGWVQSRMKNRALIWKDPRGLGRMVWFVTTGRVNLFIKAPALKGRIFQLFCDGFSMTGLIESMTVLGRLLDSIRLKAAHAVFETSQRLPYMVIDLFKLSNGIVIKSGDKTHPTSIEVEFCYPDWQEKNERLLGEIYTMLKGEPRSKVETSPQEPKPSYVS